MVMLSRATAFIRLPVHRLASTQHALLKGANLARTATLTRAASNFGYPDAASDAFKSSVGYKDWLVDEKDVAGDERVIPIELVGKSDFDAWVKAQDLRTTTLLKFQRESLKHREGSKEVIPRWDASGLSPESSGLDAIDKVVLFVKDAQLKDDQPYVLSSLPMSLPAATYRLVNFNGGSAVSDATVAAFSWAIGTYKMERYKEKKPEKEGAQQEKKKAKARLVWPEGADRCRVGYTVEATFLARDLINMPTECMGPSQLQQVAQKLADTFPSAKLRAVVGEELLKENYPQIHTVGRAAPPGSEPRLLDLTWGETDKPKVTLVGKGVMYDTGGLDIKPGGSMGAMKKDMGGAAKVLALAYMIMAAKLPVRLRVLVPSVENSVDARSYRNGDIIKARNGLTTEIISTDAEGRLVLADALVEADSEDPALLIDAATLTGAARVAMGLEVPAFFSNKKSLGRWLQDRSWAIEDPVWQLPLYQGYRKHLKSNLADMRNTGAGGSGVITAALYLESFLKKRSRPGAAQHRATPWVHVDFNAANAGARPGRPEGGDPQGMRALFELVKEVSSKRGWPVDQDEEPPADDATEENEASP